MKESTEAATFRFDQATLDQLRLEAEHKQINLNTLLNQIVRAHLEWHANAAKAGFVPIRRGLITELFDSMSRDQVDKIAVSMAKRLSEETLMIMTKRVTGESILEIIDRWIRVSGFNYHHEVKQDSEHYPQHVYVIQHDMGANWSYYLARLFEEAVSEFMKVKPEVGATENALYIAMSFK